MAKIHPTSVLSGEKSISTVMLKSAHIAIFKVKSALNRELLSKVMQRSGHATVLLKLVKIIKFLRELSSVDHRKILVINLN